MDKRAFHELAEVCHEYPGRLHALGLSRLDAITYLRPFLHSADTTKWLDGGRRGRAIYLDARTGELASAHIPGIRGNSGLRRCVNISNARLLDCYCSKSWPLVMDRIRYDIPPIRWHGFQPFCKAMTTIIETVRRNVEERERCDSCAMEWC